MIIFGFGAVYVVAAYSKSRIILWVVFVSVMLGLVNPVTSGIWVIE